MRSILMILCLAALPMLALAQPADDVPPTPGDAAEAGCVPPAGGVEDYCACRWEVMTLSVAEQDMPAYLDMLALVESGDITPARVSAFAEKHDLANDIVIQMAENSEFLLSEISRYCMAE